MEDNERDEMLTRIDERTGWMHKASEKDEARLDEHLKNHWWKVFVLCAAIAGLGSAVGVMAK